MKIDQSRWTDQQGWEPTTPASPDADLVLVFADTPYFRQPECYEQLRSLYPLAIIVGCTSSGSILGTHISDGDMVATAIQLQSAQVRLAQASVPLGEDVKQVSARLAEELGDGGLRHLMLLSEGLTVNGSDLAAAVSGRGVTTTGGLAGDGSRFEQTWVMANGPARQGQVAMLGFYGDLNVRTGCEAGWREFGAERTVTRSTGNVVYEIDHQPALELYTRYLGPLAQDLPASGLRFPLSTRTEQQPAPVIRTLLGVNPAESSLTFAGDVPQGALCRLMRADIDALLETSGIAAEAVTPLPSGSDSLCVVISCVGRRLVMGQNTEEELEMVQQRLGSSAYMTGFYSYGELSPTGLQGQCQLHNQTLTLLHFSEP
ncbi:MAG: hypothetical protein RL459_95 [Pseudomonadota bacterium]